MRSSRTTASFPGILTLRRTRRVWAVIGVRVTTRINRGYCPQPPGDLCDRWSGYPWLGRWVADRETQGSNPDRGVPFLVFPAAITKRLPAAGNIQISAAVRAVGCDPRVLVGSNPDLGVPFWLVPRPTQPKKDLSGGLEPGIRTLVLRHGNRLFNPLHQPARAAHGRGRHISTSILGRRAARFRAGRTLCAEAPRAP